MALFAFLFAQTNGYLVHMTDNWLNREQIGFAQLDQPAFLERLAAHATADPEAERPFTLFDTAGHRIGGTPLDLPTSELAKAPLGQPFEFTLTQDGKHVRYRGLARRTPSGDLLLIAENMADARHFDEILINALTWGGLVTCLLGLAGAAVAGIDAVRRIDAVTVATQHIVKGDLSQRLPAQGRSGDLDRLIHVINGMLEEIERLMQEVKGVCDSIAHDLRTPLTRLLAGLERARRRARSTEEYAAAVDDAVVETRGLLRTFTAMLRISEVESGARRAGFTSVDLAQVLIDAVEFYEPMAEEKGIILHAEPSAAAMPGDPSLLFEAVAKPGGQCDQVYAGRRPCHGTCIRRGRTDGYRSHRYRSRHSRSGARSRCPSDFTGPKRAAIRREPDLVWRSSRPSHGCTAWNWLSPTQSRAAE